eukprot:TRINITY_DN20666_c0_g1_i1.p4 TRINITY_DN20666_c0_g1~~TRINITY_DN20666_c0_g1_i1.p4  ORF type:complete len:130 (-),score=1.54 TRINITY_DN20666_c0_g1_i1:372-761(-)
MRSQKRRRVLSCVLSSAVRWVREYERDSDFAKTPASLLRGRSWLEQWARGPRPGHHELVPARCRMGTLQQCNEDNTASCQQGCVSIAREYATTVTQHSSPDAASERPRNGVHMSQVRDEIRQNVFQTFV